ncbi:hypothetical protein ACWDBW_14425 [Streptomyces sp. NPDC001107]
MATPVWAAARAGASLTPSPTTRLTDAVGMESACAHQLRLLRDSTT